MKSKYLSLLLFVLLLGIVYSQDNNPEAIITFSMPRSFDVYLDAENEFVITVKNEGLVTLHNVSIILSGVPEGFYSILPNNLDKLDLGQSSYFSVSLYHQNIPLGVHDVNVTMKSDETTETVTMTLNVKGETKETGELIKKREETQPAFQSIKNAMISIMVLSGSILIITSIKLIFKAVYFKKEKG